MIELCFSKLEISVITGYKKLMDLNNKPLNNNHLIGCDAN